VRSIAQLAQFYMTIYTASTTVISTPLIIVLGTFTFVLNAIEIMLDSFFPAELHHREDEIEV
jgi:uncharacterized membrane protein YvlD (DUF360 family)